MCTLSWTKRFYYQAVNFLLYLLSHCTLSLDQKTQTSGHRLPLICTQTPYVFSDPRHTVMKWWIPLDNFLYVVLDQKTQTSGGELHLMVTCMPYFVSGPKHTIINQWIPLDSYPIVFLGPKHLHTQVQKTEHIYACLSSSDALIVFLRKEWTDPDSQTTVNI